jgi:hypothetical protein
MLKENDIIKRTLFIFLVRDHNACSEIKLKSVSVEMATVYYSWDCQTIPLAHGEKGFFAVV